ncbi:hypothetical protein MSAN_01404000 [Mycena sanguinolenta]|uniref:3-keto sterol reductase n=1 Tax=Mycena sanguinolenta TaxID=230812 RepID=A0A8H7CYF3_9AGAR|nr:hypothetical protein MSAN_01404000 [Mycena sanguinolenta]
MSWPVVVVTGSNAGVGFGICQRLLFQLSLSNPPDSWPQSWATPAADSKGSEDALRADGLTLIMACRSIPKAEEARKELYRELDAYIAQLHARPDYDGHADVFRRNLKIEVEHLDLAVLSSVFDLSARLSKKYSYISHLIFNAGVAPFAHIDWLRCFKQIGRNFLDGITRPQFYVQSTGEVTADGLGWVWQSNMFGHYVLFRAIEPLLKNSAYHADSRVIWSSSLEATPKFYDKADWQLAKSDRSYECVKYQIDLIATTLDQCALRDASTKRVRHFVSHPGVTSTKISTNLVEFGGFLDTIKVLVFYVARVLFGSRHHPISTANGSIAAVHLALVSLTYITFFNPPSKTGANGSAKTGANGDAQTGTNGSAKVHASDSPGPFRFGSETTRWGRPEVGLTPVIKWTEYEDEGKVLLKRCDKIFQEFSEKQRVSTIES